MQWAAEKCPSLSPQLLPPIPANLASITGPVAAEAGPAQDRWPPNPLLLPASLPAITKRCGSFWGGFFLDNTPCYLTSGAVE